MRSIRLRTSGAFGQLALVALLVFPCVLGGPLAYVAIASILIGFVAGFDLPALLAATRQTWARMFAGAFVLLAIAFTVGAKTPQDAVYALDFLPLLLAPLAAVVFINIPTDNGPLYLARLALLGTVMATLMGCFDLFVRGLDRAQGIESSAIHFGNYAAILGFLSLAGLLAERSPWRWLYLLGPLLALGAVMMSGSRGPLLVFGLLAIMFSLCTWRRWIGRWKILAIGLAASLSLLGVAAIASEASGVTRALGAFSLVLDVLSGREVTDVASALRLDFYKSGLRAVVDAPWFGHGWKHQFAAAVPYLSDATRAAYQGEQWGYIHNELLGFTLSGGIFGFAAYWMMTLAPIAGYLAKPRGERSDIHLAMVLTLVIGFFAAGLTDVLYMWELPKMMFVGIATAITVLASARTREAR